MPVFRSIPPQFSSVVKSVFLDFTWIVWIIPNASKQRALDLGGWPVSGGGGLWDYLRTPAAQVVIWVAVLAALSIVGAWMVLKFRDQTTDDTLPSNGMLANFREMRDGGHLEDAEFRTIKTMLGGKLQGELAGTRDRVPSGREKPVGETQSSDSLQVPQSPSTEASGGGDQPRV